jgi:tripartite-type tricarboxylate transporter receptor subunit TctC
MRRTVGVVLFAAACAGSILQEVHATERWPSRPLRMIHGFTTGGNVDITARLVGATLAEALGQQVVVDTRPGAGGTIAAALVAKAEPDGYTLFLMASGHAASPGLYRKLPYDPVGDFTLVSLVASFPFLIATGPTATVQSVGDLVRVGRAEPGKLLYATAGVGTGMHLASVLFQARTGAQLNHVPYKGGTNTPMGVVQGEVPMMFGTPAEVRPHVESGRMKLLAVTTAKRWERWPDVPTIAETVSPAFDVRGWLAVAGPKGLPGPVVERLSGIIHAALQRTDMQEKLAQMGTLVTPVGPRESQRFVAAEVARWTKLIRDEKIPPQN